MSVTLLGELDWSLGRDESGQRDYSITWLLETSSPDIGPQQVFECPGLPAVGSVWAIGTDVDPWAFCTPEWTASPVITKEPNTLWFLTQKFTTRPTKRCQDNSIEDPMDEPPKLSGSFVKYTKEATHDKNGDPLLSSSFERFKGPQVERDFNRPTVNIEMNLPSLPLGAYAALVDHVSDNTMWGLPAGCVKLSNVSWTRNTYGTCNYYYTVGYEFDIDYNGFKKQILDEGNKHLGPGGTATNPKHFIQYKDKNKENARCLLNGAGVALDASDDPYFFEKEFYDEGNLLSLGVPTSL